MVFSKETLQYIHHLDWINELRKAGKLKQFSEEEQSVFPMFLTKGDRTYLNSGVAREIFKTEQKDFERLAKGLAQKGLLGESSEGFGLTILGRQKIEMLKTYIQ